MDNPRSKPTPDRPTHDQLASASEPENTGLKIEYSQGADVRPWVQTAFFLRFFGYLTLGIGTLMTLTGTLMIAREHVFADEVAQPLRRIGLLLMLVGLITVIVDHRLRRGAMRIDEFFERDRKSNEVSPQKSVLPTPPIPPPSPVQINTIRLDQEFIVRPMPKRGFPLLGLFILTAICAVLLGLIRPAFQSMSANEIPIADLLISSGVTALALSILGIVFGAFDRHPWSGIGWGALTGAILGVVVGPMILIKQDHFASLVATSFGGSAIVLILAIVARIGRH